MAYTTLHLSTAGGIATLTLDRPEARNALNLAMCEDLKAAAQAVGRDPSARLLFIRGKGPSFCAGADLKERVGKNADWVRERRMKAFAAYDAIEALAIPVIAVVEGHALGAGVEISSICDFIVATPAASFGTPETMRGSVGATQRLPRVIGKRLAKDLMFTGRRLTAEEAKLFGFVSRVVAPSELESELRKISEAILGASPDALRLAKRCIDRGVETDQKGAMAIEIEAIEEQLASGKWMGKQ